MTYKKLDTSRAAKAYDRGTHASQTAVTATQDKALLAINSALNQYSSAITGTVAACVDGLNEVLERLDRIETLLKQRRP